MADVAAFVNKTRARTTAYLEVMEDMVALQTEYNALGGSAFTNTFNFFGESASTYDMTQAEFQAALVALGQIITVFGGGAIAASATRQGDLYKAKV